MIGQPFFATNKAKLLLAWTNDRVTAGSSFNSFLTVWAYLVVIHFNKLSGVFRHLFPICKVETFSQSVSLFSTSGADHISACIALDGVQQFVDSKAPITLDSRFSLTNFDELVVGGITSTYCVGPKFLAFRISFNQMEANFGRNFNLASIINTRGKRISIIGSKTLLHLSFPTVFTKLFSAEVP